MATLTAGGRTLAVDRYGFLIDPFAWSHQAAEALALASEPSGRLTVLHWKVVLFVRRTWEREGRVPHLAETCRRCALGLRGLRELFPAGYRRGACRIAGLSSAVIARSHYALTYETTPLAGQH